MKRTVPVPALVVCAAIGLALVAPVRAGITVPATPHGTETPQPVSVLPVASTTVFLADAPRLPQFSAHARSSPQTVIASPHSLPERTRVPGSMALVLSALSSLGAYHGLRAAKRLPSGAAAPDWYHAEGPRQIGHATALDPAQLDFIAPALFEIPADILDLRPDSSATRIGAFTPLRSRSDLLIESPRAPPN